jgi:hypothetical protein
VKSGCYASHEPQCAVRCLIDCVPLPPSTRASATVSRVRWRIALPALMLVLSTLLMLLATKQQAMLWKMGTGWETPATIINSLINGPGYYLTGPIPIPIPHVLNQQLRYDGSRLLGIGGFWFLIGLSIDRRRSGQTLGQQHPIPIGIWFTFCAFVCGFFGIGLGVVEFRDAGFWGLIAKYPLRSTASMARGLVIWLLVFCGYFCKRAFFAARRSLKPTH